MIKRQRLQRLRRVIEAYGADPSRWPESDRRDLEVLFIEKQAMERERELILSAQALDHALDRWADPSPEQSTRDPEDTVAWVWAHAESSTKPRPAPPVSGMGGLGDRLLDAWLPTHGRQIGWPAALASVLLALGFGVGQESMEHWRLPQASEMTLDWSVLEKSAFPDVFEETDDE